MQEEKNSTIHQFFATVPKSMESLLVTELKALGVSQVKETRAGAFFEGSLAQAYRVCLWSRLANRVLFPIAKFSAFDPVELYAGIQKIDWTAHLEDTGSLAVDFQTSQSKITHSHYGALKVKDAIVDFFRDKTGERPSVQLENPDLRVNIYLFKNEAKVSIDLSGESLHKRGYRMDGGHAPLKENLAAAVLIRAGWPEVAKTGGGLLDPMCGSGTLAIEAALMAGDSAPGLLRKHFGFFKWKQFDEAIWDELLDEAEERESEGISKIPPIFGYDSNSNTVAAAISNLDRVGLSGTVHFEKKELGACQPVARLQKQPGLMIVNPPYGERLGKVHELIPLYSSLGEILKKHFAGWKAGVLTGNPDLGKSMGLRAKNKSVLFNGTIRCDLLQFEITSDWHVNKEHRIFREGPEISETPVINTLAEPFVNRLKKNLRKLKTWSQRAGVEAYRIYDQDLPEFAVAVDLYGSWVHVQEYEAPKTINPKQAEERLAAIMQALPLALNIPQDQIFLKVRKRQKGLLQYKKNASEQIFHEIREADCRFLVNFKDYLDTGLFLDHRLTRQLVQSMASGKRFLNLFAYTGSVTVYAAKGGAKQTTTVDMSRIYLDWAKKNLKLNGFDSIQHRFIEANCLEWVKEDNRRYDLIFLDPPTFSNSKKMDGTFDVQRDHVELIQNVTHLLEPDGVLIFSNNFRKFKMDHNAFPQLKIENLDEAMLPKDFARNPKIHNCWKITKQVTTS